MSSHTSLLPHNTGGRLALEWTRLRTRPSAVRGANRWHLLDHPVDDLDQILRAIGFETANSVDAEQRLRRLVVIAADDELAGRVVVQRLLPGLLAVVRRRRRFDGGDDVFDELLGAAWEIIRTFNPGRRPSCLAAALIADADYRAFRSEHRRKRHETVHLAAPETHPDTVVTHPSDELTELFREAIAIGVPEADIELLRQLLDAPTAIALARELRVTPRTVRNRRDRITRRLREVALAA